MNYVRQGFASLKSQFLSVIVLFLYQLLWGLFVYRLADTAITSLLQRYPNPPPTPLSKILFLLEGQINLWSYPEVQRYLWLLAGMIVLRLLLTPLIQAGILYGLAPSEDRAAGFPLFRGMKEFGKPVLLFYFLELVLVLLPALWIVPKLWSLWPGLLSKADHMSIWLTGLGLLLGWFLYGWIVRQCLLFIQFGYLFKSGAWNSLLLGIRHLLQGLGIALILGFLALLVFLLMGTVSWIWAGLLALIVQQTYPLFRCTFRVWQVTSQFQLWKAKKQKS